MNTNRPPATDAPKVIEVERLVTHYGSRRILSDITIDVHAGEIMVIMGGSGSGKSTLLRHLMALETPTSGRIWILGKDISRLSMRETFALRKKMGVALRDRFRRRKGDAGKAPRAEAPKAA